MIKARRKTAKDREREGREREGERGKERGE